jgi:hypothetical protein
MPDSVVPALCDHCIAAKKAFAREASLSFSTFFSNESEFHLFFLSMANASYQLLVSNGQLRDAGRSASAFLLVLASRQRWPEETLSLVVNGGCCVALCFQRPQQ